MNFLEKDLETIIWENYDACDDRGLTIGSRHFIGGGLRLRQMNLMPFGIADLVNIYFNRFSGHCWVQIIECKKDKVDANTYLQAKRYATAITDILYSMPLGAPTSIAISIVLAGKSVDTSGPIAHAVAQDTNCDTFTYSYGLNGISFSDATMHWKAAVSSAGCGEDVGSSALVRGFILDARYEGHKDVRRYGDPTQPLMITPDGILLNHGMLYDGLHSPFADGE